MTASRAARSAPSPTPRSSPPTACSPYQGGHLLRARLGRLGRRPAQVRRRRRRAGRLRAHRARHSRTPRRRSTRRRRDPLRGRRRRARRGGPRVIRRRVVRVPGSSANLGPGFDSFAAALALHLELEVTETGSLPSRPTSRCPAGARTCCVRAFERLAPADGFASGSAPRSRCPAGWARAPPRSSPGSWPPTTSSSSTPTCSRWPPRSRDTPTTSPPPCGAASSCAPTARR